MDAVVYSAVKKNQAKLKATGETIAEAQLLSLQDDDKVYIPEISNDAQSISSSDELISVALDTSRALTIDNLTTLQGRVLSISDRTISLNSTTNLYNTGVAVDAVVGTLVDTDKVLYGFDTTTASLYYCRIATCTGTSIAVGSLLALDTGTGYTEVTIETIDTNKCLIMYKIPTTNFVWCNVLTVSGTTITKATSVNLISNTYTENLKSTLIETDKVLMTWYNNNANEIQSMIINVSGTTITPETAETVVSTTGGANDVCKIETDKILCCYSNNFGFVNGLIITISGNTQSFSSSTLLDNTKTTSKYTLETVTTDQALLIYSNEDYSENTNLRNLEIDGTDIEANKSYGLLADELRTKADMDLYDTDKVIISYVPDTGNNETLISYVDGSDIDIGQYDTTGYCATGEFTSSNGLKSVPYYSF